jgi:hypothetical protein
MPLVWASLLRPSYATSRRGSHAGGVGTLSRRLPSRIISSGRNRRFDMHTDSTSISCTVTPSQKTKAVEWTDPAIDMGNLRSHVQRDVTVMVSARRVKSGRPVAPDAF